MLYICIMNLEKTKAQMRKGVLELCILSIIAEKDAYASDILEKLKEAKLIVVEGTLYPLLRRLESQGLLKSEWNVEGSRPRRYYVISPEGKKILNDLAAEWRNLGLVMEKLLTGISSEGE